MAFYGHLYINLNSELSSYAKQLDSSLKQVYVEKLILHKSDGSFFRLPDPFVIKQEEWKDDMSIWPRIKHSDISKYLDSSPGKNHRSRSAYEYVTSGKVQNVKIFIPLELPHVAILSASVQPSQRCNAGLLKVWVIAENNGLIRAAHCTCRSGFGEVCSHVSALLYKVQLAVTAGLTSAPTEEHCKWNNSFTRGTLTSKMKEINFHKVGWETTDKKRRRLSVISPREVPPVSKEEFEELRKFSPASVFFTSYTDDSCTSDDNDEENFEVP